MNESLTFIYPHTLRKNSVITFTFFPNTFLCGLQMKCYININTLSKKMLFMIHAKKLTIKADIHIDKNTYFYNIFPQKRF